MLSEIVTAHEAIAQNSEPTLFQRHYIEMLPSTQAHSLTGDKSRLIRIFPGKDTDENTGTPTGQGSCHSKSTIQNRELASSHPT